ncbi:MAG: glycosyltransferase [Acidimicrobiia bacterium]|nr:glycosyltransferase [Acidimicrobiia bacterium]
MKPRLLVVSPVHPPDDPRIRHKLIRTLQAEWAVTFAGRDRGPVDQQGMRWVELPGGRLRRGAHATWLLMKRNYDVVSLHDPEMLPAALLASLLGRTIVFDVHENVPAQLRSKPWIPRLLRRPAAWISSLLLRLAEKRFPMTLAEAGYSSLFAEEHPVFPNYLTGKPPEPRDPDPTVGVVYLGDVTEARGLAMVVEAVAEGGASTMTIMGRCRPDFKTQLMATARRHELDLQFHGFVDPDEALRITAAGILGLSPLLDTPNYRASLPTKVLEYLAVGIPTVASDLPGTRSVVGDTPGVILVPPGDLGAWRTAIREAMADPKLRADARAGAEAIRMSYVWPEEDVRAFYRELLG